VKIIAVEITRRAPDPTASVELLLLRGFKYQFPCR
jgi:hypothetical protein